MVYRFCSSDSLINPHHPPRGENMPGPLHEQRDRTEKVARNAQNGLNQWAQAPLSERSKGAFR